MNRTGTLNRIGDRVALRFERRLAHQVGKVWRAITEPAHLAQWFPGKVEIEPVVGGRVGWSFPESDEALPDGTVTAFDPPRLLEFDMPTDQMPRPGPGGIETMRFELSPDDAGCLLVFTHLFADRAGAASFATGWQGCLDGLEDLLAGRPVEDPADFVDQHERYVEAFGLAEGEASETVDGWTVRFERQLMFGVDEVWALLAGADEGEAPPASGGAPPVGMTNPVATAGTVTELDAPRVLQYAAQADGEDMGRVRLELGEGPGGARVVLTHTLPKVGADRVASALAAWHTHLEVLVSALRGQPVCPWPEDRTEELRASYTGRLGAR
jgi:uncharacterized protein YndB with AHSA1/START domain